MPEIHPHSGLKYECILWDVRQGGDQREVGSGGFNLSLIMRRVDVK